MFPKTSVRVINEKSRKGGSSEFLRVRLRRRDYYHTVTPASV